MNTSDMLSIKGHRKRISVWLIVFALITLVLTAAFPISARADNFMDDAKNAADSLGEGIGNAAEDIADGAGDAAGEMTDNIEDGIADDSDGFIEDSGESDNNKSAGWIALAVAAVVVLAIVILIIVFIPKKKS